MCERGREVELTRTLGRTCILNGSITLSPQSSLITPTSAGRVCFCKRACVKQSMHMCLCVFCKLYTCV